MIQIQIKQIVIQDKVKVNDILNSYQYINVQTNTIKMIQYIQSQQSQQQSSNRRQKYQNKQQKKYQNKQQKQYQNKQQKKYQSIQQRKYESKQQRKQPNKNSKNKLTLIRSKSKQTFLTDTQTSDHTQKQITTSSQLKIQLLQQKISRLIKQNHQLKQHLINIKANQFYTINQNKVKTTILQNQQLKQQLNQIKKLNEQITIENQFLQRNNKNLKLKLQQLTENHVRKSIDTTKSRINDISKSRIKQNTNRTINKQQIIDNNNQQINNQPKSPIQKNINLINQRKSTLLNVKSNPNLLNSHNIRYHTQQSDFLLKQRTKYTNKQRQRKQYKQSNPLHNSNQHFLQQFQKYQKQLKTSNMYNSTKQSIYQKQKQKSISKQIENFTPKSKYKIQQMQDNSKSKSKQLNLQNLLNRKKQLMNRKSRQQINRYQCQNDENNPNIANYERIQKFNEEYLIGKSPKHHIDKKNMYGLNSLSIQKGNNDQARSRGKYRS